MESPYTFHEPPPNAAPLKPPPRKPRRAARIFSALTLLALLAALIWKAQPYWFYRFTGEQQFLSGNALPVRCAIFSADGKTLFSGGGEGTNPGEICDWDAATHKLLRSWRGHDRQINALAISPDARVLASGGADGRIKLWDVSSGQELKTLAPFDYDFTRVNEITARLMQEARDPRTGEIDPKKLRGDGFTLKKYAPDNDSFYLDPDVPTAAYTEAPDGKRITEPIAALAFSPDGRYIVSTTQNGGIISWNVQNGLANDGTQRFIAGLVSDNAQRAMDEAARRFGTARKTSQPRVWSRTQAVRLAAMMFGDMVFSAQFSPDGKNLAALAQWRDNSGNVTDARLVIAANANTVTMSSHGKSSILWWRKLSAEDVQRGAVVFATDGKTLGVLEGDDLVLRDAATGKEMRRIVGWHNRAAEPPAGNDSSARLTLSPDGQTAASCRDGWLSLWKLR